MKNSNPQFCIITPSAYLQYAEQTNKHLVLAHLVHQNKEYADFYKRMAERGDYIMMDNSAYELKEPYSPNKLIDLGRLCGAHAIVLPDYPFQPAEVTVDAAKEFIPQFKDAGFETFFVPQSRKDNLIEWLYSYAWAANNDDIDIIGMSILGIPNALPNIHYAYARVVMTEKLISTDMFNHEKQHHYLGLNAGPALEIPSLIKMNALDSVDSSGPVWAGILGHEYTTDADSYQMVSKLKMPVDFNVAKTKDQATLNRIQHNLDLTKSLFSVQNNFDKAFSPWYAQE